MKDRIDLMDTPVDVIVKLSDGNPGALTVLARMFIEGALIDPQSAFGGLSGAVGLDTSGIYGARIWMLFKDVCGEDIVKTLAVLRACQLGKLRESDLHNAIDHQGEGIDVDALVLLVKEELHDFDCAG